MQLIRLVDQKLKFLANTNQTGEVVGPLRRGGGHRGSLVAHGVGREFSLDGLILGKNVFLNDWKSPLVAPRVSPLLPYSGSCANSLGGKRRCSQRTYVKTRHEESVHV